MFSAAQFIGWPMARAGVHGRVFVLALTKRLTCDRMLDKANIESVNYTTPKEKSYQWPKSR